MGGSDNLLMVVVLFRFVDMGLVLLIVVLMVVGVVVVVLVVLGLIYFSVCYDVIRLLLILMVKYGKFMVL